MKTRTFFGRLLALPLAMLAPAQNVVAPKVTVPNLIPMPERLVRESGVLELGPQTRIEAPQGTVAVAEHFAESLRPILGSKPRLVSRAAGEAVVAFRISTTKMAPESYRLRIRPAGIEIEASDRAGLFYATQTLRQLYPSEAERGRPIPLVLPAVTIEDRPRFGWRGLHLDVSRHFYPVEYIKQTLDRMAMLKLNRFHWHLTDDGGWRIEIKRYPELTRVGAFRAGKAGEWNQRTIQFPGSYGGFYTQAQIREVVAYAAQRSITVVPEIELPGHSMAALAAMPHLACTGTTDEEWKRQSGMNHPNVLCVGRAWTYEFAENVLKEVTELFPSSVIHVGGDEVNPWRWRRCAHCRSQMAKRGLRSAEQLQGIFTARLNDYLRSRGRRLLGWDEIQDHGMPKGAMLMSWRGMEPGLRAAKAGHDVVMSPTSFAYFDYPYHSTATEDVYRFDPAPADLPAAVRARILGGQANVWTEYLPTSEDVDRMTFPRILAMAEVLWSRRPRDAAGFSGRVSRFYPRLSAMGIRHNLPAPLANYDATLFARQTEVRFAPSPVPGSVIRFTTDGSEPTPSSPVYRGPIALRESTMVSAAVFAEAGQRGEVCRVNAVQAASEIPAVLEPGLHASYAEGSFERVPDFRTFPVKKVVPVANLDAGVKERRENYAIEYRGFVRIPRTGLYRITLGSDDGAVLRVGSAMVVDHDGFRIYTEQAGRVHLTAGLHPISLGYFQAVGEAGLEWFIEGPGMPKRRLPASMLFRPADVAHQPQAFALHLP